MTLARVQYSTVEGSVHTAHDGGRTIMRFDQKASHTHARRHACTSTDPQYVVYILYVR
jgi:hypothetical protein